MARAVLTGEAELRAKFKAAAKADFKAANLDAAKLVADTAVERVPVLSGRLRDSIRAAATPKNGVVRAGFTRIPYAGVIHFGWPRHRIEPNPFLYDAVDQRRQDVIDVYEKRLAKILAEADLT